MKRHDEREVACLLHLLHNVGVVPLGRDGVEHRVELHRLLLPVEGDGTVVDFQARDLLHDRLELVVHKRRGAVLHHGVGGRVVLNVVHVQEHRLL